MENRPHFKPGAVKYTKGYGIRLFFHKLFKFIIILLALAIMATTIYIYIKQPVKYIDSDKYVTATQVNRMLQVGEEVLIIETENYNLFTPLERFIKPQLIYTAEVIAGPYGKIKPTNTKGQYTIIHAKNEVEVILGGVDQEFLEKEYVIRRLDMYGKYVENSDKIVDKTSILGLKKTSE